MRTPTPGPLIIALVVALAGAALFATTTVTVTSGDTLTAIAARHGVTTGELVEWNDIEDPDRIFVGDVLVLAAPRTDAVRHVVSAGDTLWLIAARYGATVAAVAEQNELADENLIRIGEVLTIGGDEPAAEARTPGADDTTAGPTERLHTVAAGDTLFSIARGHGVSVATLASANGITDPDRIRIGDVLTLPAHGGDDADPAPDDAPDPAADDPTPDAATDVGEETAAEPTTPTDAPAGADDEPGAGDDPAPIDPGAGTDPETPPAEPEPAPTPSPPRDTTTSAAELGEAFGLWSVSYGVEQGLLEAIAEFSTGWNPGTVGPDGRLGIAQLTEAQIEFVETRLLGRDLDPLDTSDGVRLAARYLRFVQDRTQTEDQALRAFRQGLDSFLDDGPTADADAFALAVQNIRDQRR